MLEMLFSWYRRHFSDPQAVALAMILLISCTVLYFLGSILAPLLTAIVLAYLLEWPATRLEKLHIPRQLSILLVLLLFIGLMLLALFVLVPIIWHQVLNLARDLPIMLNTFHDFILALPHYALLVDAGVIDMLWSNMHTKFILVGEQIVKRSMTSLVSLVMLMVYLILIPLISFFLLKDKPQLLNAVRTVLPRHRLLAGKIGCEMNLQIARYLRGKSLEIVMVSIATYALFVIFDLRYSLLLALLVGLSTLIPYIGAVIITIPVVIVALFQWGIETSFWYFIALYTLIQILDGNLLVPLLFSETLNLHPLVIILSTLFFGGLWGFWGLFFAIPLATLVKAILNAWPMHEPALDHC